MVGINGFATLIPAFSMLIPFTPSGVNFRIGPNDNGNYFEYSPSLSNGSYLRSEPGYGNATINATIPFGVDQVTLQTTLDAAELDFKGVAVTDDDSEIFVAFTGTVRSGPQTSKLFTGDPSFNGSDFGWGYIALTFQVGTDKYKYIEDRQYVASQRYLLYGDDILALEFKVSEVA